MNPDPFTDTIQFAQQPGWPTIAFWILALSSIGIAVYVFARYREQRTVLHLFNWLVRLVIGMMWWEQTLWKLPPTYTDQPDAPLTAAGLGFWMAQMGKSAAFQVQADLVNNIILPHFYVFAPIVYGLELLTAISLILGLTMRLWAAIGALQILNLWLGLYSAPHEWPWTYFFLLLLQAIFVVHRFGRSLGLDTILSARAAAAPDQGRFGTRLLEAVT